MKTIKITEWLNTWGQFTDKSKTHLNEGFELVEYKFNGVTVFINAGTDLELIWRDYLNAQTLGIKSIGPLTIEKLPADFLKKLSDKRKQLDKEQNEREQEYKRKDQLAKETFINKTISETFVPLDEKEYVDWKDKNTDAYSKCCFDYAEDWAKLMQVALKNGETIKDCAERTSFELGFHGITGFMYGMAVNILSKCWKHGEELRKWHNKEYGHEGDGVVNPAILTIKS